jgi:hypothetical protein
MLLLFEITQIKLVSDENISEIINKYQIIWFIFWEKTQKGHISSSHVRLFLSN